VECDNNKLLLGYLKKNVSIHTLLVECDYASNSAWYVDGVSIHTLLVECDKNHNVHLMQLSVSIHTLLVECDAVQYQLKFSDLSFQSTHSSWSVTNMSVGQLNDTTVSIHTLLVECDLIF